MTSEDQMLEDDFQELSDDELVVLLIMSKNNPTLKTRLQKLSLIYNEVFLKDKESSHGAYFFGGYSDSVDESASNLADIGILEATSKGYVLTDYGLKLQNYVIECFDDPMTENVPKVVKSMSQLTDRSIVGLTYFFYENTTVNSTIKSSVSRMNDASYYDGRKLTDIPLEYFENKVRNGEPIKAGK